MTPSALDRCNESGDWLRSEIEIAIDERRNIIPLFFDGFNFGNPLFSKNLTGKLENLKSYNGLEIPAEYFDEAMDRLRSRYLKVTLDAVLHPVSEEVQKAVKEQQVAANIALEKKEREDEFERLERERRKVTEKARKGREGREQNLKRYGIGGLILVGFIGLIFGGNYILQNLPISNVPAATKSSSTAPFVSSIVKPTGTNTISSAGTITAALTETPSPTSTLGYGSKMVSPEDGMTLVYVPADNYLIMGSENGSDDEKHVHFLSISAFWIDQTEITNVRYAKCVDAGKCNLPVSENSSTRSNYYGDPEFNNYPVIYVSWEDANAYCSWANRRLPTEAEWEKAACGTDARTYPWGKNAPNINLLNYNNLIGDTTEVGKYPDGASPYGALDMAGNVWEWVKDWYDSSYYQNSPLSNPKGSSSGEFRVLRGGSWSSDDFSVRSAARYSSKPSTYFMSFGFRCAMSASE